MAGMSGILAVVERVAVLERREGERTAAEYAQRAVLERDRNRTLAGRMLRIAHRCDATISRQTWRSR